MKTYYEWGYETTDTNGDIADMDFADCLSQLDMTEQGDLVLVRDTGNEEGGLQSRYWAYVKDGKLPEYFQDARGEITDIKVPQIFHKAIKDFNNGHINASKWIKWVE